MTAWLATSAGARETIWLISVITISTVPPASAR
jgi:hypothetical protein